MRSYRLWMVSILGFPLSLSYGMLRDAIFLLTRGTRITESVVGKLSDELRIVILYSVWTYSSMVELSAFGRKTAQVRFLLCP